MKGIVARAPVTYGSSVDLLADALDEVGSNVKAQVDSASVLVHEVALADPNADVQMGREP